MTMPTYRAPEHATIAVDAIGSIVVSTIVEFRGSSVMGYETAIKAGEHGNYVVVGMYWEEFRAEALAAHALLVEQLGAMM